LSARLRQQHAIESPDPICDALGIIEPIDAQDQLRAQQALAQAGDVRTGGRLGGTRGEVIHADADRKGRKLRFALARHDRIVGDTQAEFLPDVVPEVQPILVGLKSDQIIGQHRLNELAMLGYALHDGARRPRRMQEKADGLLDPEPPQLRSQGQEVIILDPEGRVRPVEAQQRARHERVDLAV
jgi:hypothetical protein